MNDLAREVHRSIGKTPARLIRVVHGAVHAVAEAELAGEVDGEPAGPVREIVRLDAFDDFAVVVLGQHAGDGTLQVEPFPENERGQLTAVEC